jgi:hypothetical protein
MQHAPIFTIQEIIVNSWKSHDGCQSNGSLKLFLQPFFFFAKEEWCYENLQGNTFAIHIQLICSISNNL